MKNLLLTIFTLFLLNSCGGKGETSSTDFTYSVGGIVHGTQMDGGFYLWAIRVEPETGEEIETQSYDLNNDSAEIPFGNWKFFLVGYEGPGAWSGTNYCGSIPETLLDSDEVTLDITINSANCSNSPYTEMIAEKAAEIAGAAGVWNSSSWNNASWSP